jgi:thiamine pyrophosphokinase
MKIHFLACTAAVAVLAIVPRANGAPISDLVSADIGCQTAREKADRAFRSAVGDVDSLSACLRRSDRVDNCEVRFRAIKNLKDTIDTAAAQVDSACR